MKSKERNILTSKYFQISIFVSLIIIITCVMLNFGAFSKFVRKTESEISLGFREIKIQDSNIIIDYSEYEENGYLKASIITPENLQIKYKIDNGEYTTYTTELQISEDCTLYTKLTNGTIDYPETSKQIKMPVAKIVEGNTENFYDTLQDAISICSTSAGDTTTTIVMIKNVTEYVTTRSRTKYNNKYKWKNYNKCSRKYNN